MIYGVLWLGFVWFLWAIRHLPPKAQAKYGALAGVALSAAAWLCYRMAFEPGPTSASLRWAVLGLFALYTVWTLLSLALSLMLFDEPVVWSPTISIFTILPSTVVFTIGTLGYPTEVAITAGVFVLSVVIGRRR